jgi:transcriptional regulator with GAF, ATPase, and Fis domain
MYNDMYNDGLRPAPTWLRWVLGLPAAFVVGYAVIVLGYVATSPDLGYRTLLADDDEVFASVVPESQEDSDQELVTSRADGRVGVAVRQSPNPKSKVWPRRGDILCEINRKKTRTFLDFSLRLAELRDAPVPPGGNATAGTDPTEMAKGHWPGIVDVEDGDRQIEIVFIRNGETPAFSYVPQISLPASEIGLTFVWFLFQLGVLIFGAVAFWNRPYDAPTRLFCAMCTLSLGAFVGGFHWWVIAGSPFLNVPFLICAGMLPATTLHFFLVYPREKYFLARWPILSRALLHGPPALVTGALVLVYLAACWFNGNEASDEHLATVLEFLSLLHNVAYFAIGLAGAYFVVTVGVLGFSFFTSRSPIERKQVRGILLAALLSAIPMSYVLVVAIEDRVGFAFGRIRYPMFFASLVFMLAYVNGMVRHKLMLVDEIVGKGKLYYGVTACVMMAFALLIAVGGAAVHMVSQSLSGVQLFVCFTVLMMGILLLFWLRDRIQQMVDRRFFSEKYQLDKALQRMNRAAGRLADAESLAQMMLVTCRDALQTDNAAIYFRQKGEPGLRLVAVDNYDDVAVEINDPETLENLPDTPVQRVVSASRDSMSPVQGLMYDLKAELIYPVETDGHTVGLVVLGPKSRGTQYTAEDLTFLRAIAQITTIALNSATTNQELARVNEELQAKVDRIAEQQRQLMILKAELDSSVEVKSIRKPKTAIELERAEIKGSGEALNAVLATVEKVAPSSSTVLIHGESGTGKELLARTLHRNSPRKDAAMVSVHCAALSEGLLESELFGHAKGAFTGAHEDKIGRFEAANGGTLFLDEIGDISPETQVKLLRVLQERCFEPVGSSKTVHVDVRLITATNRDLNQMIADGRFREDLYYRLNVIRLDLPPLRERRDDLIELVFHFINRSAERTGKQIRRIEPEALAVLERYRWPGNIRELENTIERAVVLADGDSITLRDLPGEMLSTPSTDVDIATKPERFLPAPRDASPRSAITSSRAERDAAERDRLASALAETGGNKAEAARRLGLPRSTFYSKLKKYQLSGTP